MGNSVTNGNLETWDVVIIVLNFVGVFAFGIWASWGSGKESTSGYFLAGRQMPWYMVGLSLWMTNIGSRSFIGIAGSASVGGYGVAIFEFQALNCLLLLAFVFLPIYFASEVSTVPEYLKFRFGGDRLQMFIACINLITAIVIMLASEMYAASLVIQQSLGWDIYTSIVVLLLMTAVYTVAGGLKAVIYTDAIQAVIMMIGAFALTGIAFSKIDWSMDTLRLNYMAAIPNTTQIWGNTSCGIPQEGTWHIFHPADDSSLPWPGSVFGALVLGCYFWCTNQVIVQRTLAAKNVTHGKGACIMTGYFKILPMFLMIIPGMISRSLWPDYVACVDPDTCESVCGNRAGCSDIAYPRLVVELMPTGLRGLMLATMLAAMISSLTSIFNASSSMFVLDIWYKIRPRSTELELVIVGKLSTVVMVVFGVLWIPIIQAYGSGELFTYMQAINSYLTPAVFSVFTAAILFQRVNETGAFWGLVCGFLIGLIRAILEFVFGVPACGQEDNRPAMIKNFHYLHFAAFVYALTVILVIGFSYLKEPVPPYKLVRLLWWNRFSDIPRLPMSDEEEERRLKNEEIRKEKQKQAAINEKNNLAFLMLPFSFETTSKGKGKGRCTLRDSVMSFIDMQPEMICLPTYLGEIRAEKRPQPFILALYRENVLCPTQTFVIAERRAVEVSSLLEAVDICYKLVYILDVDYQVLCKGVWQFIEHMYEQPRSTKGILTPSIRAFRTYVQSRQSALNSDE